ncbi:MAG TPA: hypothetical protein VMR97_01705 [Acidimicrobiales bacterium]|nr:hypothetical protein [Acidimicrobiales bacterium]
MAFKLNEAVAPGPTTTCCVPATRPVEVLAVREDEGAGEAADVFGPANDRGVPAPAAPPAKQAVHAEMSVTRTKARRHL